MPLTGVIFNEELGIFFASNAAIYIQAGASIDRLRKHGKRELRNGAQARRRIQMEELFDSNFRHKVEAMTKKDAIIHYKKQGLATLNTQLH